MACSGKHQFNEETLSKRLLWQLDIPEHTQTQSILLDSTGIILLWWPLVASLLVLVYLNISLSIELQGSTYLSSLPLSPLTELLCTFVFILFSCCPWFVFALLHSPPCHFVLLYIILIKDLLTLHHNVFKCPCSIETLFCQHAALIKSSLTLSLFPCSGCMWTCSRTVLMSYCSATGCVKRKHKVLTGSPSLQWSC